MSTSELRLVAGCVLAVAVPAAALHLSAPDPRLAAGLTAPPFGWPRLLVAHLVAALPLGLIAAQWVRSIPDANRATRGVWVAVGLAAAGAGAVSSPGLGEAVAGAGAVAALVLRALLAVGLVLPWCVWATDRPPGTPNAPRPGLRFALGAGIALVPCGLYAEAVVAARTEHASELLGRERLARADVIVGGLIELGSELPVGGRSPAEVRDALAAALPRLRQAAEWPLPAAAPPAARLNRAVLLVRLDRSSEAAGLLEPLAVGNDTAALLLATVYRDLGRWAESDALFSRVLDAALPRAAGDPAALAACQTAIDGLAFNAREDRRPADVERVLVLGLGALPSRAAYFHLQLGRHHADGGRPFRAVEHLREAARLDPERCAGPAEKVLGAIRSSTPACLP
ncbi:hypothetical protein [Gemmata sp.]|uniref:hypothetical protein n=1 Tax=Gemmata sp. TaxID=1914242 RepID=UPI003F6EA584